MPTFRLGLMAEQWMKFESLFLRGASDIQRREMKRAFYAGAQSILFKVIQGFAPEGEPTTEDLKMMDDLNAELQQFAKLIKEGKA